MKNRLISTTDMLVSRSEIQESMATPEDEFYVCRICGIEYTNPFKPICGYDNGTLIKVVE